LAWTRSRQRRDNPGLCIYIERINAPFLSEKPCRGEFGAGLKFAIERGRLLKYEGGTYVKLMPVSKNPLAR
jgi:hypothetical protein